MKTYNKFFVISVVVLIFILAFAALLFGYEKNQNTKKENKDSTIRKIEQKEDNNSKPIVIKQKEKKNSKPIVIGQKEMREVSFKTIKGPNSHLKKGYAMRGGIVEHFKDKTIIKYSLGTSPGGRAINPKILGIIEGRDKVVVVVDERPDDPIYTRNHYPLDYIPKAVVETRKIGKPIEFVLTKEIVTDNLEGSGYFKGKKLPGSFSTNAGYFKERDDKFGGFVGEYNLGIVVRYYSEEIPPEGYRTKIEKIIETDGMLVVVVNERSVDYFDQKTDRDFLIVNRKRLNRKGIKFISSEDYRLEARTGQVRSFGDNRIFTGPDYIEGISDKGGYVEHYENKSIIRIYRGGGPDGGHGQGFTALKEEKDRIIAYYYTTGPSGRTDVRYTQAVVYPGVFVETKRLTKPVKIAIATPAEKIEIEHAHKKNYTYPYLDINSHKLETAESIVEDFSDFTSEEILELRYPSKTE